MSFNPLFGERLKEERVRLGLTQIELAEKSGQSREMLGKYERGAAEPGAGVLMALAAVGMDMLYVLSGQRTPQTIASLSSEESALLDNYKHSDEEGRAAARRVLSSLAQQKKVA